MGLNLKHRQKRVLPALIAIPLYVVDEPNSRWALNFMHCSLY
ncbi:hypothetical protein D515_01633 [Grimontia indica]|uniref:Uncharacterized protein n=1 Tax=Grimontia indica TaxID=1056512 RepID=R1IW67_9GAMM|nr:hypothetical protein D515_01633 [Grimontia indica]